MTHWLLAQATDPGLLIDMITRLGLPTVLVIFFVWNGQKREIRMAEALAGMEQFQRTELAELNRKAADAMNNMASATKDLTEIIQRHHEPPNK